MAYLKDCSLEGLEKREKFVFLLFIDHGRMSSRIGKLLKSPNG